LTVIRPLHTWEFRLKFIAIREKGRVLNSGEEELKLPWETNKKPAHLLDKQGQTKTNSRGSTIKKE
jgi:hypothetical protein